MRQILHAAALVLFAVPAFAQTPAPAPAPAPAARPAFIRPQEPRVPLPERFAEVNTTKDGHVTRAQASAANWYYVNRNFEAIDKDRKGYVTVDDIRGYARTIREQRDAAPQAKPPNKS